MNHTRRTHLGAAPLRAIRAAGARAAFTLIELLVVIGIILALVSVTVPSFARVIESVNYTASINTTVATLGSARARAMKYGVQTAVAFLFDARTEQYTLLVLQEAPGGSAAALTDDPTGPPEHVYAVAFRPAVGLVPAVLPRGAAVFALAFNHVAPDNPFDAPSAWQYEESRIDDKGVDGTYAWYAGEVFENADGDPVNPWIFPRNDPSLFWEKTPGLTGQDAIEDNPWSQLEKGPNFVTDEVISALRHANSFCVQFNADGAVVNSYSRGASAQPQNAYIELIDLPINRGGVFDEEPYDGVSTFDPERVVRYDPVTGAQQTIMEPERNPEVSLRSVSQLAVVDLTRLRQGVGGLDKPWLLHPSTSVAPWPDFVLPSGQIVSPTDTQLDELVTAVSRWIDLNGEILGFDRYTGSVLRRTAR